MVSTDTLMLWMKIFLSLIIAWNFKHQLWLFVCALNNDVRMLNFWSFFIKLLNRNIFNIYGLTSVTRGLNFSFIIRWNQTYCLTPWLQAENGNPSAAERYNFWYHTQSCSKVVKFSEYTYLNVNKKIKNDHARGGKSLWL